MGHRRSRHGLAVATALSVALLLTIPQYAAPDDSFSPPRDILGSDSLCRDYHPVASDDGLVYLLWKSDPTDCDFTVWDPGGNWKIPDNFGYCERLNLMALSSGLESWNAELNVDLTPSGEFFFARGVYAAWQNDIGFDILHLTYSASDSCGDFDAADYVTNRGRQIRYARLDVNKTQQASISVGVKDSVSMWQAVNDTIQRRVNSPKVTFDDSVLHFMWADSRCDAQPQDVSAANGRHFGVPMYRKRLLGGSWSSGSFICTDQARPWSDNATLANYELQDECDCCPRGYGLVDSNCTLPCTWFQGQAQAPLIDGSGDIHVIWHDTDQCFDEAGHTLSSEIDNVLYRKLRSGGQWGDISLVSSGGAKTIESSSCFTTGDTLLTFYGDMYNNTCGVYYRVKSADSDSFPATPHLAWESQADCPFGPYGFSGVKAVVASRGDSVYMVVHGAAKRIYCGGFPDYSHVPFADPSEDSAYTYDLWYRKGKFSGGQITWSGQDAVALTDADDDTSHYDTQLVLDSCGNLHLFYTEYHPCSNKTYREFVHRVLESTHSDCEVAKPNGAEVWCIGDPYNVRWSLCPRTDRRVRKQKIFLSRNSGSSWTCLEDSLPPMTRVYNWTITGAASTTCRIKIVAYLDSWSGSEWVFADSTEDVSDSDFRIRDCGGGPCPHLYTWRNGEFHDVNSILRRGTGPLAVANDHLVVTSRKDDEGYLRFMIKSLEPDTTYLNSVLVTPLGNPGTVAVTADGRIFLPGDVQPPLAADHKGDNILELVAKLDGSVFWGENGTSATIDFPGLQGKEALILVSSAMKDPPDAPLDQGDEPAQGLHLEIAGGPMFVTATDTIPSLYLSSRQYASTMAVLVTGKDGEPFTMRISWNSDHPLDRVGFSQEPQRLDYPDKLLWPEDVEFIPNQDSDTPDTGFPYKLLPGDRVVLRFRCDDCEAIAEGLYMLTFNGYYTGPMSGARTSPIADLGVWFTSQIPCTGSSLSGKLSLPHDTRVSLRVYDIRGRLVSRILDADLAGGLHSFTWDLRSDNGSRLAPGMYILRCCTPSRTLARKVVIER